MGIIPVKTPLVIKKMLPDYIWELQETDKVLYLTFDDGPTPQITNWTLKTLNKYNAKATFFCIGNNIKKHTNIFHNILDNGHAIGNHSNTHLKGWLIKKTDYISDIEACQNSIDTELEKREYCGSKLFRPPYGQIKPKQGKALLDLDYKIIMWNVLSFDWDKNVKPETCLNNVISKAQSGSIIVFHDSLKASRNLMFTLPKVLKYFSEKGYSFKALNV
ncbi:polysaccharide deacetylase family protein [Hanstruepera ponticola]|uniref:polysaccharide deacetylase family protein n=1 Tax=Hanstruepera ponticola TaxID=2042995 RepID=UPI00177D5F49|nr:polysaccharide deacetylase family protein [Hanstruepera ponticola]